MSARYTLMAFFQSVSLRIGISWLLPVSCALFLSPLQLACSEQTVLTREQAVQRMNEGRAYERAEKLQRAYYAYNNVETSYESNDELRREAAQAASRVRREIKSRVVEIEPALSNFVRAHGRSPESLVEISDLLSPAARIILSDCTYRKTGEQEYRFDDGIID